jgi:hypothetical protein
MAAAEVISASYVGFPALDANLKLKFMWQLLYILKRWIRQETATELPIIWVKNGLQVGLYDRQSEEYWLSRYWNWVGLLAAVWKSVSYHTRAPIDGRSNKYPSPWQMTLFSLRSLTFWNFKPFTGVNISVL